MTAVSFDRGGAPVAACVEQVVRGARFATTQRGGSFTERVLFDPSCDAPKMAAIADALAQRGDVQRALHQYSDALSCRASQDVFARALDVACRGKAVIDAQLLFVRIDPAHRDRLARACAQHGTRVP